LKLAFLLFGSIPAGLGAVNAPGPAIGTGRQRLTKPSRRADDRCRAGKSPYAKETNTMLEVGQVAPDFTLRTGSGEEVRLATLRGSKVVLYFYPKDMTSGCTQESCDFRDLQPAFHEAGTRILGISPDSEKSHLKFAEKYGLPFDLLADPGSDVCTLYGVWKEKSMYGRTYMGVERTTVLIDDQGVISRIWSKVKVNGHANAVLAAVQGSP
jgi:peroxiredoxin Q/BCP